ncbi:MAG: PGPGW domain-containing protein [Elusimicrobiota bacterium]|jgi:hypothetical protein
MIRRLRTVLFLALCAPLPAAAQAVRVVSPVSAVVPSAGVPVPPTIVRFESGLMRPTLPVVASAFVPSATVLAAPVPSAASLHPASRALVLPAAAVGLKLETPGSEPGVEPERRRPVGRFAELRTARTLPRLVFDGAVGEAKAAAAVEVGPGHAAIWRTALARAAAKSPGAAIRFVRLHLPARPDPARPSLLKRLRASPWGLALGYTLLVAGAVMVVGPGPGMITVLAGLYLLSPHSDWARRGFAKVRAFAKGKIGGQRLRGLERFLGMY